MSDNNNCMEEEDVPDPLPLSSQVFGNQLILSKILSFLDLGDLKGCRLVNRFWNRNSLPYFFETSHLNFERVADLYDLNEAIDIFGSLRHPTVIVLGEKGRRILATYEGVKGSILPWVQFLRIFNLHINTVEDLRFLHEIMRQVAPSVKRIRISGGTSGDKPDEVRQKGMFPSSVIFPQLKHFSITKVGVQNGKHVGGIKGPQFLQELFTAAPNITEIHIQPNATTTELVEVVGDQFPGLFKQITTISLDPTKSPKDFKNTYGILQKFKGLKTLKIHDIVLDHVYENEANWKTFISKFALLSSPSLTMLDLDFRIIHLEPYSCPLYFPYSPNLEWLYISTWICKGDEYEMPEGAKMMKVGFKDEKGNHFDVINYEKCFPKLKELTLHSNLNGVLERDPFFKAFLPPGGVVCKTLTNLEVSWHGCDYTDTWFGIFSREGSGVDVSEVKARIASIFPNANVTMGDEYFHK